VLDYASCVASFSYDEVTAIASKHLGRELDDVFRERFGVDLPETLNADHRMLVVGSEIDASSERIIRYLSDEHGVNINAATFNYFRQPDDSELLARVFLIEPSEVERSVRAKGTSKRQPNLSRHELQALAATRRASTGGQRARARRDSSRSARRSHPRIRGRLILRTLRGVTLGGDTTTVNEVINEPELP
jgi:hypothetical protein